VDSRHDEAEWVTEQRKYNRLPTLYSKDAVSGRAAVRIVNK